MEKMTEWRLIRTRWRTPSASMRGAGIVGRLAAWQIEGMRWTRALMWGAGSLLGCGGSGTTALDPGAPGSTQGPSQAVTLAGPICPSCVNAGGETSDFDGGQDPCWAFVHTAAVTDGELESAGVDVAAYRHRIERSFEAPLRWTDLTTTSALPRARITGFDPETTARVTVTTGAVTRQFFDASTCALPDQRRQCATAGGSALDCGHSSRPFLEDAYALHASVELQTDDGALDATLSATVGLDKGGPPVDALAFHSRVDVTGVMGTLVIEPPPAANRGSLDLHLGYFDDSVRGRLEVNFTNGWRQQPGAGLEPLDDQPLIAALQGDDCPFDVSPAAASVAHDLLGGRMPADVLSALRTVIAQTERSAAWSPAGGTPDSAVVTFEVEVRERDHACVTRLRDDRQTSSGLGSMVALPIRVTSSDGRLDWSALATYELGDAAVNLPHRLWFEQQLMPGSSRWAEAFPTFELAAHTRRVFLRFAARYPEAGAATSESDKARAVFEIFEESGCPGNDPICHQEQAASSVGACLVSPPGSACSPSTVLARSSSP